MEGKDIINAEKLKPFDVYGNVLYHYCSMETFKSIIEKKELWLCNARHSNDSAELQYIMYIAKQMKKDNTISDLIYKSVEKFYGGNQAYITCFSEEANLLSQWRGYTDDGKGFSVGFHRSGLMDNLPTGDKFKTFLKQIEYVDGKNKDEIQQTIKNFNENEAFFKNFMYGLNQYIWKDASFGEEKEVRLITLLYIISISNFGQIASAF